jgi:hypothetical protein
MTDLGTFLLATGAEWFLLWVIWLSNPQPHPLRESPAVLVVIGVSVTIVLFLQLLVW